MDKITSSQWFTRLLALFFALLLFFNVNSEGKPVGINSNASLAAVAEQVPIRVKYDETKYYVASYEETTTVYLKSSNKVLLDIETNEQTRNFKVEADLTGYGEGTYEVPLKVTGLNQVVEATLKDKKLHVRIEKRESRVYDVTPKINDNLLKNGYTLENIMIEPEQVEITSGANTLDQIDQVVAALDDDRDLSDDLSKRVDVVALDKEGNVLSVIIVPTTVTMSVHVEAPSKSVPLKINQSGAIPSGIKSYEFTSEYENITISGPREALDKVTEIELFIDTTTIFDEKTDKFSLTPPENIKVDPVSVEVTITPIKSEAKPEKKEAEKDSSTTKESTKTTTKEDTTSDTK